MIDVNNLAVVAPPPDPTDLVPAASRVGLSDQSRLLHQLMEVTRQVVVAGHQAAGAFQLAPAAANALSLIEPGSPPPSMRELARRLGVDPSRVTALTDEMEGAGLLERRADPGNRRVKLLSLTASGAAVRSRLMAAVLTASPISLLTQIQQRDLGALLSQALGGAESGPCHTIPTGTR